MSADTEIVRILRGGGKLSGRDIHERGSFHDLQGTLAKLQEMSLPGGAIAREKPANSGTFVYWMKNVCEAPAVDDDELPKNVSPAKFIAPNLVPEQKEEAVRVKPNRSGAKLHEHLFRTLERLEAGEIDHVQAKAVALISEKIIKLAEVQLLYEQLKKNNDIPALTDMPLVGQGSA